MKYTRFSENRTIETLGKLDMGRAVIQGLEVFFHDNFFSCKLKNLVKITLKFLEENFLVHLRF